MIPLPFPPVPSSLRPGPMRSRASRIGTLSGWMLSLGLCTLVASSFGADGSAATVKWQNLRDTLPLEGAGWTRTEHPYDRLPADARASVRPEVWKLAQDSAGLCYRFVTDATALRARWKLRRTDRLALSHMAATGVSGLDLYVRDAGEWHWLAVARPDKPDENERLLVHDLSPKKREYLLYLPLYNGIESIELGLPEGAALEKAPDRYRSVRPLVFYGTSILQGGCASRPGMAYPAILGRALDRPSINLGFSGNGKSEPEMAELLAQLDPAAYVLDSLPNLTPELAAERVEPFIRRLREAHPATPIVLVENVNYADTGFVEARRIRVADSNTQLRNLYEKLKEAGDAHLHYVASSLLLGGDGEDTVDGTHPTDLGFHRMAVGMEPILRAALADAGEPVVEEEGFVSLFDGKTLGDWKRQDGMPPIHRGAKWWVEDGALCGTQDPPGTGGLLWLNRPFKDFVLKLQVKLTWPMDTGVFLRMAPNGLSHQVCVDYREGSDIGAIFIPFVGHRYVSRFADGKYLVDPEKWNDLEIRIEGNPARIRVWMNSRLLTDYQHTEKTARGLPPQGGIALQVHPTLPDQNLWGAGNIVRYRNIRIKELNRP